MKKTFFFDIDGTLLPYGHDHVLASTKYALAKLKEKGHDVYIATGKSYDDARRVGDQLGIDSYLTANGQVIYQNGNIIREQYFTTQEIQAVIEEASQYDIAIGTQGNIEKYLHNNKREAEASKFFKAVSMVKPDVIDEVKADYQVTQMWLIGDFENVILDDRFEIVEWATGGADVVLAGSSKGRAIKNFFDLDTIETYAFGDGDNDIEMFKNCHLGIAMGNASAKVQEQADIVIASDIEHGIYKYLVENNFIEEHDDEANLF